MKFFRYLISFVVVILLFACGGGGGSPGAIQGVPLPSSSPVAGTTTTSTSASDIYVGLNKTAISNSGNDSAVLSVVAVNAAGGVIQGVPVNVSVDSNGVFVSSSLVSDVAGAFTGNITSPVNKADRIIKVKVTVGTIQKTLNLLVTGSKISVTTLPGAPTAGQPYTLTVKLTDSAGIGIASQPLTLSGDSGLAQQVMTDIGGNAVVSATANAQAGTYTVTVTGSGVTTNNLLRVVPVSGTGIPVVTVAIGPGSLNASPTNIKPNLAGGAVNRSVVKFQVLDANNQGIANVRVIFKIDGSGLGSGEVISTGGAIVFTNSAGIAESEYIAGLRTSPTNGVQIKACYGADNAAAETCQNFALAQLTVGGAPLNLSIFDDNKLAKGLGGITYIKDFVVQVGDAAGNPVADATISASVDITHYGKGLFGGTSTIAFYQVTGDRPPNISDTYTTTLSQTSIPNTARVWCLNEDLNRNGTRDAGDDLDKDGVLESRASEIVISAPNGNRTDSNGQLLLRAIWGQNMGTWLAYTIKTTTNVAGSEGSNSRSFITGALQEDVQNGAFLTPPYGINNCSTNN
jgi:hypothetical protein